MGDRKESQINLTNNYGSVDLSSQKVPWWDGRTRMEKGVVVLAGVLGVLVISLVMGLVLLIARYHKKMIPFDDETGNVDNYCHSKGCITTAAYILDNLDDSVNPCDDFYQFACGGYIEKTVIPDDHTRVNTFSTSDDKLNEQVRILLDTKLSQSDPKPFHLSKSMFKSCMNTEKIEDQGLLPLQKVLERMGGWPVVEGDKWVEEGFRWFDMVYKFRNVGFSVDYLLDFSVTPDLKNSSLRVLDLDQPSPGLAREYLIKGIEDEYVQAYLAYMKDVAKLLGADEKKAEKEMLDVLTFEIVIANMSLPREMRRDDNKLYNPMTISQLSIIDPKTPWLEYVNNILTEDIVQVDDSETIIVDVPSYVKDLSDLLSRTSKRVQANYLMWRAVASSMSYLTEEADKIRLKFSRKITGLAAESPRWKRCVEETISSLPSAVGSLYVSNYFDEASKASADEMVSEIRKQFDIILDQVEWMDEKTRQNAKLKLKAMSSHIGYPPELLDMTKLEDLYDGLDLGDKYFENVLNMTIYGTNYAFKKLRKRVDKGDWVRYGRPAVVNAFYSPLENSINFPAGILQGTFFSSERPHYMNYGAIGWVIGHEITHGFDDHGKQYDQDGNLVEWWLQETKDKYMSKAQCIISQYSNYTIDKVGEESINVNGINTQGENIADNGGIKESYRAYSQWTSDNGPEKLLPGLPYSPQQLFWISAANVWCSKYRPEALARLVTTGVHSPPQFRVMGTFSNMKEFAADFSCPVGSRMNPGINNKCQVW